MITVIANLKGGTGKSTVAFNLSVWLRTTERRTAVIDLDPQRTLSDAAALRVEEGVDPIIRVEAGTFSDVTLPENAEEIIIDVGTADLGSFKQALMIADRILIPVTPSQADIWSTQRFVQFLYKNTHGNPPEAITFLNRADTSKESLASDEAAAALDALPGVRLIQQRLCNRDVFRDSFSEGLAVFELEPRSIASREFVALAEALFGHGYTSVLSRLNKQKKSATLDPNLRHAFQTPSAKMSGLERFGLEEEFPSPMDVPVRDSLMQTQLVGNQKQKAKPGKKNKLTTEYMSTGKVKEGKKEKKQKKGGKGKKGKK